MMHWLWGALKSFWTRSIRRQLMFGIILVHAVLMSIFVFDLVERQRTFLHEQSVDQAFSLTETLAANAVSWVLASDVIGLEEVIQAQSNYPGLRYAMVLSPEGRVLGHTDNELTGLYISDATSRRLLQGDDRPQTLVADHRLIDVAVPIVANGRPIGWARVGLSQAHIARGLELVTRDGVLYTLLAIAVGALFAYFMAKGLTRGLQHLVAVADRTRLGARGVRADLNREDELGRLAEDFNQMLDVLIANEQTLEGARERLAASEERFDLAMRGANDGLWDWDLATDRVYYSPRWQEMFGYRAGELSDSPGERTERILPDDHDAVSRRLERALSGKDKLFTSIHRMRHRDGTHRWVLDRAIVVRDAQGRPERMVGTTTDITARKAAEDRLFEEKERALVTLHSIGDAVITTDEHGRVEFLNPIAEMLTGWSNDEAQGLPLPRVFNIVNEDTNEAVENPVERCLREGYVVGLANHTVLIHRQGEATAIEDSAAPIRDRDGEIIGAVLVFHDVSENRELAKAMNWQATHDALTDLVNRREFERRLSTLLDDERSEHKQHAFLYLDLDQFKLVNDTCGHEAGDELLRQLAFLLQEQVRDSDTLARLGGDEFGILLSGCKLPKAQEIAEEVRTTIDEFRFAWNEKSFDIGVSIGLVSIDENSASVADILSAADIACYAAKDMGGNRVHLHQPDDVELARRHGEMQWVTDISEALEEDRFVLYRQRIVSVAGAEEEEHSELLLRMLDRAGEIVMPGTFIPAAERYNMMARIDRWVVRNAFRFLAEHPERGDFVAINLSGATLADEGFLDFVRTELAESHLPGERICFEITETAAITNLARAIQLIRELRKSGCRFALDDFGSGLSSFAYLKTLPVDFLKIDGSFVKDMADDPIDRAMVDAIARVGHVMGIRTIAEFVENDAILEQLRAVGVDFAQGFGIHRPEPLHSPTTSLERSG